MSVRASLVCAAIVTAGAIGCATQTDWSSISSPDTRFAQTAGTTGVTVTTVVPSESPRGTTLDVQINGTGFDNTSQVTMPLHGVIDPRVHVNSTQFVKSTQVIANVTITSDAALDMYDVVVALSSGKKGIGSDAFVVVLQPEVLVGGYHVKAIGVTGDAVGDATNPVSCNYGPLPTLWHPDGSRVTLPTGTTYCGGSPQAINASGVILGSLSGGPANSQGMWFPSGGSYVLQVVPATPDGTRPITAGALNDNNEIFGWSTSATKLYWWSSATGWLPVQVPANTTACQSFNGINNHGELVARCTVGGVGNGYYWSSHSAAPLLLPRPAGTGDVSPRSINDGGVIVGNGPGGGLRWQPTSSGYVLDIFPGTLNTIASDGTIAGSVIRNNGSNGRSPVIFYSPSSYQILGLTATSGTWGDAGGIALTANGIVVGGTEGNAKALRWKVP
jgi:hypothetical protein